MTGVWVRGDDRAEGVSVNPLSEEFLDVVAWGQGGDAGVVLSRDDVRSLVGYLTEWIGAPNDGDSLVSGNG